MKKKQDIWVPAVRGDYRVQADGTVYVRTKRGWRRVGVVGGGMSRHKMRALELAAERERIEERALRRQHKIESLKARRLAAARRKVLYAKFVAFVLVVGLVYLAVAAGR